jgi:hypothetical protein
MLVTCLPVLLLTMQILKASTRGNLVLVARHLSFAIGADVCYGKWGEGSYTSGKPGGGYMCSNAKPCTALGFENNVAALPCCYWDSRCCSV